MAKKTTRQRKQITQQRAVQQAIANTARVTAVEAPAAEPSTPQPKAARTYDTTEEYRHIRGELRRIALLAGGIIVTLIILSFVIR